MLISFYLGSTAVAQTWNWGVSARALSAQLDVGAAPNGMNVMAGVFTGNMIINTVPYSSNNFSSDIYVVSRDISGNVNWVTIMGGSNEESLPFVAVDSLGYTHLAFNVPLMPSNGNDSITLGSDLVLFQGGQGGGAAIVLLDPTGNIIASKAFYGKVTINDICVGSDLSTYVAGSMEGATFYDSLVFNNTMANGFIAKINASNSVDWVKRISGVTSTSYSSANGIAVGPDNSVSVSANYFGTILVDSQVFTNNTLNANGLLLKYNALGSFSWGHEMTGGGQFDSTKVATDQEGNIIVAGQIDGYAILEDSTSLVSQTLSKDIFLIKCSPLGDVIWAKTAGGPFNDNIGRVRVNQSGRIYLSGHFQYEIYFDQQHLMSQGSHDAFVAKYSPNGQVMWVAGAGSTEKDWGFGLAISGSGQPVFTTGITLGLASGNYILGSLQFPSGEKGFVAAISDQCMSDTMSLNISGSQMICNGDSLLLTAPAGMLSYQWNSGENTQSIYASQTGWYSCVAFDAGGCAYSSNSVDLTVVDNLFTPEICLVTVDTTSTHNVIIWDRPPVNFLDSIIVYREISSVYYRVGAVDFDSLSYFIDSTSGINPQITSYRYKLSSVDNCGNESALSSYHETMHLTSSLGSGGEINLVWDGYVGFPINKYKIWRDSTGTGNYELLDSVGFSNFTYSDINPPQSGNIDYVISVQPPAQCNVTRAVGYNSSRSNRSETSTAQGISSSSGNMVVVAMPNPSDGHISLEVSSHESGIFSYQIHDMNGRLILEASKVLNDIHTSFSPETEQLAPGIYYLNWQSNNNRGALKLSIF